MTEESGKTIALLRRSRKMMFLWMAAGVIFTGVIFGQGLSAAGDPERIAWAERNPYLIVGIMLAWGFIGIYFSYRMASRKP